MSRPLDPVRAAFARFAQLGVPPERREDVGLHAVFREAFPVATEGASLEYCSYSLEPPRRDADECARRGMTWAAPLKLTVRLILRDDDGIRDVKEQEVYFGEVPLMTERGTFVIDGGERVLARPGEAMASAFAGGVAEVLDRARALLGQGVESLMPHDVINARAASIALRELFVDRERCAPARTDNPAAQVEQVLELAEGDVEVGAEELAPFCDDAPAARAAITRARVLAEPEAPKLTTGRERAWAEDAGEVRAAPADGALLTVASGAVVLLPDGDAPAARWAPRQHLPSRRPVLDRLARAPGPTRAGDVVFESIAARAGGVALGRNARVRFEDGREGAVVRAAFAHALRGVGVSTHEVARKDTRLGVQERATAPGVDASGIVPLGARVRPRDVLVAMSAPKKNGGARDVSLRAREEGRVARVDVFARAGVEQSPRHEALARDEERGWDELAELAKAAGADPRLADLADARPWRRWDELPPGVVELVRVVVEHDRPLVGGARIADRRGFGAVVVAIEPDLDVDVVLPGPAPEGALRELDACGALYLMHLAPASAPEAEDAG